jgi:hypothetical protein
LRFLVRVSAVTDNRAWLRKPSTSWNGRNPRGCLTALLSDAQPLTLVYHLWFAGRGMLSFPLADESCQVMVLRGRQGFRVAWCLLESFCSTSRAQAASTDSQRNRAGSSLSGKRYSRDESFRFGLRQALYRRVHACTPSMSRRSPSEESCHAFHTAD